ncbi:GNAT family N-acetyltransferase [Streptomyces sp. DG2A-72]|uniref:GNAT family N-acetyltransferase n=1 Tax=Streptomyces sp. DG2A-72 TaxID=3051386 RepID=UPI00265C1A4F|nr:GNAT family N-acetyltransferase [Streptomyces sp. DG2A-72]MDO0936589.1 GNAT family N-acetyltransferase [Streptomyces sp. DG2A-72]
MAETERLPAASHHRIRRRLDRDLDACVLVLAAVHEQDGYPLNWPANPHSWLTRRALLAAWVAEQNGQIVGHIGLSRGTEHDAAAALWSAREGQDPDGTAVISRLFVCPAARGHGLGAALLDRALSEARSRELQPVLDVVASDTSAVALYERSGWRLLATVDQQWDPHQTVTLHCYTARA